LEGRATSERSFIDRFGLDNLTSEIKASSVVIERHYRRKLELLEKIVDCESRLCGIYFFEDLMHAQMDVGYVPNRILNNTVGSQAYRSSSALLLVRNTFYGSARLVIRQFFEALVMAKWSMLERTLVDRWELKDFAAGKENEINLTWDIFDKLKKRRRRVSELRRMWAVLSDYSHPTRYSQQPLRTPDAKNPAEMAKFATESDLLPQTEYTLDLLFMMLVMNYHLLAEHVGKMIRTYSPDFESDPDSHHEHESKLKRECDSLFDRYFHLNDSALNEELKKPINEYEQSWTWS
jgi:hypothetical protein